MELRCDEVRNLLEPSGSSLPLSDERAEQVAEHLDRCPDCERRLSRHVAAALASLPVGAGPSLRAVRHLMRRELRRSTILRLTGLAAAGLALAGTGWAMLGLEPGGSAASKDRSLPPPIDAPIPEPPRLADLSELDRNIIRSEGVVALYLQFCLTCINDPTEQDKQEFLTRTLLVFREVRGRIRSQFENSTPPPKIEAVTLDALNDALRILSTSKLPSVNLLPTQATGFQFVAPDSWRVDHLLGKKIWHLTLHGLPDSLNVAYVRIALGANDALLARLEETLWMSVYVALPKHLEDKDPTIGPRSLKAVLPLLSPRQQAIYRKLVGTP
jgi:hypothetical protein